MLQTISDYIYLCKPKVVVLMLITSWVGMYLASVTTNPSWNIYLTATIGIALAASSAAVLNQLLDRKIDALMSRTQLRPIASGRIQNKQALLFAFTLAVSGIFLLLFYVNMLVTLITMASMFVYAIFYTIFLKRITPQNIVIGGIAGASPPILGWTAISGDLHPASVLLAIIIFTWTPPHFWALAIWREQDYAKANVPMLPVTHGVELTRLFILLYTFLLVAVSLLPFATKMSNLIYLVSAVILGGVHIYYSFRLYLKKSKQDALKTFNFSIVYLTLLFVALLVDSNIKLAIWR